MATIQQRPFSKNYSGLINQSVIAVGIFTICLTSHALMRWKRRGRGLLANKADGLGSVETWEFGYLFQGRSWARNPSPPLPRGFPLNWIKQAIVFPEDRFNELRGVDASVYIRFLRGCFWYTLTHTLTTLPILFPIHVKFSDGSVSPKSMTRASISSLAATTKGLSLLWIHLLLLIWVTATWIFTLCWICTGAFKFRSQKIQEVAEKVAQRDVDQQNAQWTPHPHPQYPFQALPPLDEDGSNRGLRMRTVMVTNIPPGLRSEKELKEYFEYYLSRPIAKPSVGVPTVTQPGILNTTFAFLFNRAKHIPNRLQKTRPSADTNTALVTDATSPAGDVKVNSDDVPVIDRVILVRKMSDLASLLERREEVLRLLETAHIRLAQKTLTNVKEAMDAKPSGLVRSVAKRLSVARPKSSSDEERGTHSEDGTAEGEDRMQLLIRTLGPYVQHTTRRPLRVRILSRIWPWRSEDQDVEMKSPIREPSVIQQAYPEKTVWQALLSLPRSTLDAYQPLIHLSALFRGKTVPTIDYYTAKLNLLTSLIAEKRSKPVSDYVPMNTAFVTFSEPAEARRACKYLAVHPNNPYACMVTMAPQFEDLDWNRLMKPTFRVEFVKDWVINTGVWAFTILWLFPVSIFVGLVSIQNISAFWPGLKRYLDKHEWEEEILQSFIPTILLATLAILVPLLLLLIAKKAHTISTLSALHDRIMTRYYKFLIVNVLVFFCVGTVALQSFLLSFKSTSGIKLIQVVSDSFPSAGPFYVGWLIFSMGMHGGFELALFGLPLLVYPTTKRQVTPRKRAVGIRPRTFNYYYWLPNHLLVLHVLLVFSVLNPLVIPFGWLYFCVESTIIKNQLLHVYAKNYEGNGQNLLIRMVRYSLDGLILSQVVFLAYMVVLKKTPNVAVSAILIVFTALTKMTLTRVCRARYERDDILEADIVCGTSRANSDTSPSDSAELLVVPPPEANGQSKRFRGSLSANTDFWTMKLANRIPFSYATIPSRSPKPRHLRNPFQPEPSTSKAEHLAVSMDSNPPLASGAAQADPAAKQQHTFPDAADEATALPERQATTLCSPHPVHPSWDDDSSPDHGYDNPYYTRKIVDALWLPRDPLGILDLDDTVDLRVSMTSEPGAGKLGTWSEEDFIGSTMTLPSALSSVFSDIEEDDDDLSYSPIVPQLHGDEFINLPSGIASRVENLDKEHDVEEVNSIRRPSILQRQTSSSKNSRADSRSTSPPHLTFRQPSTSKIEAGPSSGFRSFSLGAEGTTPTSATSTHASSDRRRRNRASTMDTGSSLRPIIGRPSTARSASKSLLSVVEHPSQSSGQSSRLYPPSPRASSIVSTRDAVVGEVIVEEQEVAQERLRREADEAEKAQQPRSLLTAWMFAKPQDAEVKPP